MARKNCKKRRYYKCLPPLPKIPLTKEQRKAVADPLEVLSDKWGNRKPFKKGEIAPD